MAGRTKRWLTPEIFGFGLTSFFSDLAHEVATTLLPVFLASMGAPAYAVGLMEGLADGLANAGKLFGGWISDRVGKRKSLALAGYILTGVCQGLYCLVTAWPQALAVRALGWAGRGLRSPIRDALFHAAVGKEVSGRAFGFERSMDTMGAVLAPLAAYFFVSTIGLRHLFAWTWIPAGLAVLCFFALVRERKPAAVRNLSLWGSMRSFSPEYKRFLVAVTLFGLGDFSHTILIFWAGLLMAPVFGMAKAGSFAILLYVLHNVVYAAASYPVGRLADRVGKYKILAAGYFVMCAMFVALIFARGHLGFLALIFALGGLGMAAEDTLERAVAGDLLPSDIKGTGYGVLATLNGCGDVLSSILVGVLLSWGSVGIAFGSCAVMGAVGALMMRKLGNGGHTSYSDFKLGTHT